MSDIFKSGFVSIIGMPNAGKSTLYNHLLGEALAIVNPKAQTTRHRILGVKNGDGYQIVYSDTPGVLNKTSYKMHDKMMHFVNESIVDSDVLVLVLDIHGKPFSEEIKLKFDHSKARKIVALNKVDLSHQNELESKLSEVKQQFNADIYLPISAEHGFNTQELERYIEQFLPEHPAYFPDDQLTDKSERFFVNEIVRNQLLKLYDEEVPYACEVNTLAFKESDKIIHIHAEIFVERESQRPILIGKGGSRIKQLGIESRKNLEGFFNKQVHLELHVKVKDDWRNDDRLLRQFGYEGD